MATFVSIGNGLAAGGPGGLLLGFMLTTFMVGLVNHCMAEMTASASFHTSPARYSSRPSSLPATRTSTAGLAPCTASRLRARPPKFYRYTTRNGIPVYCLATSLAFATLAFLSVSSSTATVIDWLINSLSSAQIINYIIMCVTCIFYERAAAAQDFDRKKLPCIGWFQPYCAYIALTFYVTVVFIRGYRYYVPQHGCYG